MGKIVSAEASPPHKKEVHEGAVLFTMVESKSFSGSRINKFHGSYWQEMRSDIEIRFAITFWVLAAVMIGKSVVYGGELGHWAKRNSNGEIIQAMKF